LIIMCVDVGHSTFLSLGCVWASSFILCMECG
jgi:hypothetical protein